MQISSGIAGTPPDLNAQVNQLAKMALQSGDHMGFLKRYLTPANPNRLAAQLAQGLVQEQMQGAQTQQQLNPPQFPTVLDQKAQQLQQGMAAMPVAQGMFDPSVYAQGGIGAGLGEEPQGQEQGPMQMARGGVVAFQEAGSVADKVAEYLARHPTDAIANERVAAERYKPMYPGEGFGTSETPEAKLAREARVAAAQERVAARATAEATPATSEASRPGPTQPAELRPAPNQAELKAAEKVTKLDGKIESAVNKGKDPTKLIEQRRVLTEGIGARTPVPTVQASGIASPGPTTNAAVRAVTPGAQAPTPPPAAAPAAAPAGGGVPPQAPPPGAPAAPAGGGVPPQAPPPGATAAPAAPAAKPGVVGRGLSSLGRIAKFGLGAPLAAGIGFETGQYLGNQLNEYTPIQENIRGFIDQLGMANPNEDRANAAMQPGFIETQMRQNKTAKAAGVNPETMAIANNVSRQEAGGDFLSPEALGRVNPQKDSFGAFQLYKNGGLPAFIKSDGARFGITAPIGTPEFVAQWKNAAAKQPTEFGAAQLKAFETGYLNPTRNALASVLPGTIDPKVLNYFASRQVQGGLTSNDKKAILDIYNDADGDTRKFLEGYAAYDKQNYYRRFSSESAKKSSDKTKYDYNANAKRVDQNLTASLGMTVGERMRDDIRKGVDTAKEVASVVRQQPLVQGAENLGRGLVDKARGYTADKLESIFPLNTGLQKPSAPAPPKTAQQQYADIMKNQQPAAAEPAAARDDKIFGMDRNRLGSFLMQAGAAGLANPSQYASVSLGKGLQAGFAADEAREGKIAERTAKAEEKANDRAEKLYKDDLNLAIATRKSNPILNFDQNPELQTAMAKLGVLNNMAPSMRRRVGVDDAELKRLQQLVAALSKVAPAAGAANPAFKVVGVRE